MSNRYGGAAALRSALLVTGSTYIGYAVGLIVSMVVARTLGPREFGYYAYLVWLAGTLTMLFCNGLTLTAIRFVSECIGRDKASEAQNVHHLLIKWYAWCLIVFSLVFACAYPWLKPAGWDRPEWVFALAALICAIAKSDYTLGASISKGYGHFEVDAYTINFMSIANLVGVAILAFMGVPLEAYILLFVCLCIGHSLFTRLLMSRATIEPSPGSIDEDVITLIRKHYWWSFVLFLVFALSNKTIETLFLNAYVGPEAVGWFAIAAAMTRGGVDLLTSGLNTVLLPMMSHAYGSKNVDRAKRIVTDAIRLYFFLGITLAGVGVLWAAPVVSLLYGAEYAPAIIALQVMMFVGALAMPEGATAALLMSNDRQSVRVILAVCAVFLTLVSAIALVPSYGFEGALTAHAVSRMLIFIAGLVIIVRLFEIKLPYLPLLGLLASSLVGLLFAVLILLYSTSLIAQLFAGAVYAIGCVCASLLFKVWKANDIKILTDFTKRIPQLQAIIEFLARHARLA